MGDPIEEFLRVAKRLKAGTGEGVLLGEGSVKAVAKELKRLRADERKRIELARRNGRAGGRPRAPDAEIKPASLKRREYRAK